MKKKASIFVATQKKTTKFVETNKCKYGLGFCQGLFFLCTYVRVKKNSA